MAFLVLCLLALCCHVTTQDTYLFATTHGDEERNAGLYGALVNDDSGRLQPKDSYDFNSGYRCTHTVDGGYKEGLPLRSVAYDQLTGRVLLQREERESRVVTLYEGHVCQDSGCPADGDEETNTQGIPGLKTLFDAHTFSVSDVRPLSFAMQNGVIFFVSQQKKQVGLDEIRSTIELRRFTGCYDRYPISMNMKYDIEACSVSLAQLIHEQGKHLRYEPMAGLKIAQIGDELFVFITLQQIMFNDEETNDYDRLQVSLYMVNLDVQGRPGQTYILHNQDVGKQYRRYIMEQLGNIDFKEDKICWSAVEIILCGDFNPGRRTVRHIRQVLLPGEASGVVCSGPALYANVTTGLAIADITHDVLTVFFGCMAGVPGIGGAGYVKLHHYEFDVRPTPKPILNGTDVFFAGQMFITHACSSGKDDNKPLAPIIDETNSQKGPTNVQASSSAVCLVLSVTSLIMTAVMTAIV